MNNTIDYYSRLPKAELLKAADKWALSDEEVSPEVEELFRAAQEAATESAAEPSEEAFSGQSPEGWSVLRNSPFEAFTDEELEARFEGYIDRIEEATVRWYGQGNRCSDRDWVVSYAFYFDVVALGGIPSPVEVRGLSEVDVNRIKEERMNQATDHLAGIRAIPKEERNPLTKLVDKFRSSVCALMTTPPRTIDPRADEGPRKERLAAVSLAAGRLVHFLEWYETHPEVDPLVIPVKNFLVQGFLAIRTTERLAMSAWFREEERRIDTAQKDRLKEGYSRALAAGEDTAAIERIKELASKLASE